MKIRRYRHKLKGVKQKKGKNKPHPYKRVCCRVHPNAKLIWCDYCRIQFWCPLCQVKCNCNRGTIEKHPILGKMTLRYPYWSEDQIKETELPYYDNEE